MLDTASFVAAVRSNKGAAREVVSLILRQEIVPLMDLKLGLEYRDVALRPEHVTASRLSQQAILQLIHSVEGVAEAVEIIRRIRPLAPDANDDMVLDVAYNGHAEAVVTMNVKHFAAAGRRLNIPIVSPAELLSLFKKGQHAN